MATTPASSEGYTLHHLPVLTLLEDMLPSSTLLRLGEHPWPEAQMLLARGTAKVVCVEPGQLKNPPETQTDDRLLMFHADYASLPFEDGTFDLILAHEALLTCPNPAGVLAELRRILAPEGLALFSMPNFPLDELTTLQGLPSSSAAASSPTLFAEMLGQHFGGFALIAQTPFFGFSLVEQLEEGAPPHPFELRSELLEGHGDTPLHYLFLAGAEELTLAQDFLVQVPWHRLSDRLQEGLRLFHQILRQQAVDLHTLEHERNSTQLEVRQEQHRTHSVRRELDGLVSRLQAFMTDLSALATAPASPSEPTQERLSQLHSQLSGVLVAAELDLLEDADPSSSLLPEKESETPSWTAPAPHRPGEWSTPTEVVRSDAAPSVPSLPEASAEAGLEWSNDVPPFTLPGPTAFADELRHSLEEVRTLVRTRELDLVRLGHWRASLLEEGSRIEDRLHKVLAMGALGPDLCRTILQGWRLLAEGLRTPPPLETKVREALIPPEPAQRILSQQVEQWLTSLETSRPEPPQDANLRTRSLEERERHLAAREAELARRESLCKVREIASEAASAEATELHERITSLEAEADALRAAQAQESLLREECEAALSQTQQELLTTQLRLQEATSQHDEQQAELSQALKLASAQAEESRAEESRAEESLKEEIGALKLALESAQSQADLALKEEVQTLRMALEAAQTLANPDLEEEVLSLRQSLEVAKAYSDPGLLSQVEALRQDLEAEKAQAASALKRAADDRTQIEEELALIKRQLEAVTRERNTLQAIAAHRRSDTASDTDDGAAFSEMDRLRVQLDSYRSSLETLRQEVMRGASVRNELVAARDQLVGLKAMLEAKDKIIAELTQDLNTLRLERSDQDDIIEGFKDELASLREVAGAADLLELKLRGETGRSEQLSEESALLQARLAAVEGELEALKKAPPSEPAEEKLSLLMGQLADKHKTAKRLENELEQKVAALAAEQTTTSRLRQSLDELSRQLSVQQSALEASEQALLELERSRDEALRSLTECETERNGLKTQLASLESREPTGAPTSAPTPDRHELTALLEERNSLLVERNRSLSELRELLAERDEALTQTRRELAEALEALTGNGEKTQPQPQTLAAQAEMGQRLEAAQSTLTALRTELEHTQETAQTLEAATKVLEAQLRDLREVKEALEVTSEEQIRALEQALTVKRLEETTLREEIQALRSRNTTSLTPAGASDELGTLKDEVSRLRLEATAREALVARLQQDLEAKSGQLTGVQEVVARQREDFEKMRGKIREAIEHITKLHQSNLDKDKELESLKRQLRSAPLE